MNTLIKTNAPLPWRLINEQGTTPLLLVCDHASNYIPASFNRLGLDDEALNDHIAWDIGSADLATIICDRLNCRAVLATHSRLLIDVNRDPADNDPSMIPEMSDDYLIPGNQNLSDTQKQQRIEQFMEPYHQAIQQQLQALADFSPAPLLFSIHTFTPMMKGTQIPRPWHAGMLWNTDPRIATPLIRHLRQHDHLLIGDNEPYSARDIAYTINRHGQDQGYPNCAIEIRQDLLKDRADCLWWAERLAEGLEQILKMDDIQQVRFYKSD